MAGRFLLLALLLAACRPRSPEEIACLENDTEMRPSQCFRIARTQGWAAGWESGHDDGYDGGYEECEADHDPLATEDTGDEGDTGDTGDSGDTGDTDAR